MDQIVVTMPPTVEQQVKRESHVESMGNRLPFKDGQWLTVSDPTKVVFHLDPTKTATFAKGRYWFAFPVMIPTRIPKYNVYHISFCKMIPGDTSTCSGDPQDPRVFTTLPLAGFKLGEVHPQ